MAVARIYSYRFLAASVMNTWVTYYVPGGYRAIVKSVVVANLTAQPGLVYVNGPGTCLTIVDFPAAIGVEAVEMYQVVYGGESISCHLGLGSRTAQVSGYLFLDDGTPLDVGEAVLEEPPALIQPPAARVELA